MSVCVVSDRRYQMGTTHNTTLSRSDPQVGWLAACPAALFPLIWQTLSVSSPLSSDVNKNIALLFRISVVRLLHECLQLPHGVKLQLLLLTVIRVTQQMLFTFVPRLSGYVNTLHINYNRL